MNLGCFFVFCCCCCCFLLLFCSCLVVVFSIRCRGQVSSASTVWGTTDLLHHVRKAVSIVAGGVILSSTVSKYMCMYACFR